MYTFTVRQNIYSYILQYPTDGFVEDSKGLQSDQVLCCPHLPRKHLFLEEINW